MTRFAYLAATVIFLAGSAAQAAVDPEALGRQWFAEGFTAVEVTVGRSQVKVEGIRGGQKAEAIYDAATGAVLKRETEAAEAGDDIRDGILLRQRDRDFVRVADRSDDGSDGDRDGDDNRGRGRGGDDDDGGDDRGGHGSGDGPDHDSNDDHGGGRGGDDRGGSGSDGRGGDDD